MNQIAKISDQAWKILSKNSFDSLISEPFSIGRKEDESIDNLWWISLRPQELESISKEDLVAFLEAIIENRRQQVQSAGVPMLFYAWFDDTTGNLAFSLISGADESLLPFPCTINPTISLTTAVEKYLAAQGQSTTSLEGNEPAVQDVFVQPLIPEAQQPNGARLCKDMNESPSLHYNH